MLAKQQIERFPFQNHPFAAIHLLFLPTLTRFTLVLIVFLRD